MDDELYSDDLVPVGWCECDVPKPEFEDGSGVCSECGYPIYREQQ